MLKGKTIASTFRTSEIVYLHCRNRAERPVNSTCTEMKKEVEKISLIKCRSILQKNGLVFSDNDVLEIRDFLYRLAELDYKAFLKMKQREAEFKNQQTEEKNEIKKAA